MEDGNSNRSNRFEGIFSKVVRAGKKRTYFIDVRSTRANDYYLTITESKRRFEDGTYERHKLHLYKEDFTKFIEGLEETINYVKEELMPEYDFDEFNYAKFDREKSNYNSDSSNHSENDTEEEESSAEEDSNEEETSEYNYDSDSDDENADSEEFDEEDEDNKW